MYLLTIVCPQSLSLVISVIMIQRQPCLTRVSRQANNMDQLQGSSLRRDLQTQRPLPTISTNKHLSI